MTRLKFLTGVAHPRRTYNPGDEVAWEDDADAQRLVDAGFAEFADGEGPAVKTTAGKRGSGK